MSEKISSYRKNLIDTIIKNSSSSIWSFAVREWDIVDVEEDETVSSKCICGKENIKYLYTIRNRKTNVTLYPIGSSCIQKFDRDDMNDFTTTIEKLYKLLHAYDNRERITLNSTFFSRKLIKYLYDDGVFTPDKYNGNNPENDYMFMLDMFNKGSRGTITSGQQSKINGIICFKIIPYLKRRLRSLK